MKSSELASIPGYDLTAVDVSGSRITRVRVRRKEEAGPARLEVVQ